MTITGGTRAGVIVTRDQSPDITNCHVKENNGGGVVCHSGAAPRVSACEITGNIADEGSAIFLNRGSQAVIRNCIVRGNRAGLFGGAVLCSGSSSQLLHCTVTENFNGGVRAARDSTLEVAGCILWDNFGESLRAENSAQPHVHHSCVDSPALWPGSGNINVSPRFCGWASGPDIFVDAHAEEQGNGSPDAPLPDLDEALEILSFDLGLSGDSPCIATGLEGANMGADRGVCVQGGPSCLRVHVASGDYESPRATRLAHGVSIEGAGAFRTFLRGPLVGLRTGHRVASLTVAGSDRGGIYVTVGEAPTIESCTITENFADEGGGIYCDVGSSPILCRCAIVGNYAARGSGLHCVRDSSPTLIDCRLQGNRAVSSGGAVRVEFASVFLDRCQIHGNEATRGAGLYASESVVVLRNASVLGNVAEFGAALLSHLSCVELDFCTIAENTCDEGVLFTDVEGLAVPIDFPGAGIQVRNSIVWGNAGSTVGGSLELSPRVGHSLFEEMALIVDEGDNVSGAPDFVARGVFVTEFRVVDIADRTLGLPDFVLDPGDYHLVSESPGIDVADAENAPERDLGDASRPCGDGFDVGAYESGACGASIPFRRGDVNGSGKVDISDSVSSLLFQFGGAGEPGCLDALDVDDNARIEATDALVALIFLFRTVQPIAAPGPRDCGRNPSPDTLGCLSSPCVR